MPLIECKECGKEISNRADVCPHCGVTFKTRSMFRSLFRIIGTSFLVLIVATVWLANTDNLDPPKKQPPKKQLTALPPLQEQFIAIASNHRIKYQKTTNQLVKDSIDDIRLDTLKKLVQTKPIKNWIGKITHIDSTLFNEVILSVAIDEHLVLSTSYNTLLFAHYETLIKDSSILKETLYKLEIGQKILFSGSFPTLEDNHLVDVGDASKPVLLFKFSEIKPIN